MLDDNDCAALLDMKTLMELFHGDAVKRGSAVGIATTLSCINVLDRLVASRNPHCLDGADIVAMENARLLMVAASYQMEHGSEGDRAARRCIAAADKVLGH